MTKTEVRPIYMYIHILYTINRTNHPSNTYNQFSCGESHI